MQTIEGGIADITEGCNIIPVAWHRFVGQSMAVAIEGAPEGSIIVFTHRRCDGDVGIEKYREIARVFGVKDVDKMSQTESRDAAIKAVRQLSVDVGIPTQCVEIKESDLDALADDALKDACYPGNPREATHAQVVEMFRKLM